MMDEIKSYLDEFRRSDVRDGYRILLNAADIFITNYKDGVENKHQLGLGIELIRELVSASLICSTREFENDYKLYREFTQKKIKVFKLCIPKDAQELRGITELLFGMKENELG